MIPTQGVVLQVQQGMNQSGQADPKLKSFKRIMRGLGYAELVIGLICSVLGIAVLANAYGAKHFRYQYNYQSTDSSHSWQPSYTFNLGEGLWCGVWIVISGALGVACGRKTLTPCLLNSKLAFSVIAAFFSITMFSTTVPMSIMYSGYYQRYGYGAGIEATLAVLSFTTFIICIVSASYCCCGAPSLGGNAPCCVGCCGGNQQGGMNGGQVMYMNNPGTQNQAFQSNPVIMQNVQTVPGAAVVQVPVMQQQAPGLIQPQYVIQQPTTSQQQSQQQVVTNQQQANPNIPSEAAVAKQQEAATGNLLDTDNIMSSPPSYEM